MREDAALAHAVARWEERLAPMTQAVKPVEPPARVWRQIEERIAAPRSKSSFWRALGLLASGAAAALVAVALLLPALRPAGLPPAYVAVLSDPRTQKAVMVVS